jgi:hypothetical protein
MCLAAPVSDHEGQRFFTAGGRAPPRSRKSRANLSPMRMRFAVGLAALTAISGACGGRFTETGTDGTTGGRSNASGTASFGASTNSGATAATGGVSSGGGHPAFGGTTGYAGTASSIAGSAPIGGGCACDAIACAPGFVQVPNPDGCCFRCVCNQMLCPGLACATGYRLETRSGQCCSSCVPDDVCDRQRSQYQDLRKQLIDKYSSLGCMTANDCTVYYEKNQCQLGCGIVMPRAGVAFLDSNLQSYAQQNCTSNCAQPEPPCDASPVLACLDGRCLGLE